MQVCVVLRRMLFALAIVTMGMTGVALAQGGPDNRYCNVGDHPAFGSADGPAALPQACIYTAMSETPSGGKVISVAAGGDLQGALNSVQCGETISLAPNATFLGNYLLPALSCDSAHWITIRTSAPDSSLPPEGTRLTPCYAGVSSIPGRPALQCAKVQRVIPKIVSKNGTSALRFKSGANHYRLIGLEVTRPIGTGYVLPLVEAFSGYAADHIILDRMWIHGAPIDDTKAAFTLTGMTNAAVIDSYLNDFHCTAISGSCTDAHAVGGGVGTLPGKAYKIVNNFLEASGENFMLGGGPSTTTPTDIEVRRNHFFKPLLWMQGQPGLILGVGGHPFATKNLVELKNGERILFEGNIFENSWGGFSQGGALILLNAKNQQQGSQVVCPSCAVTDITIRYSKMSHSGMGIAITAGLTGTPLRFQAKAEARFSLHDITVDDINAAKYKGGGVLFQIGNQWAQNGLNSVAINHVTGFADPISHLMTLMDPMSDPKITGVTFNNNLVLAGDFPVWSAGGGSSNCAHTNNPLLNMNVCFGSYSFAKNGIIGSPSQYPPSQWPANNFFPANPGAVDFVNYANANGGDYHLLSSSPYKNAGTDGKDLGADIDTILSETEGVE